MNPQMEDNACKISNYFQELNYGMHFNPYKIYGNNILTKFIRFIENTFKYKYIV